MRFTDYKFDFEHKEYHCPMYDKYHLSYSKEDIAYRYRIVAPGKSEDGKAYVEKRKVLLKDRNLFDPITGSNVCLSGKTNREGEVKYNIIWIRENNDITALSRLLSHIEERKMNRKYYQEIDDILIGVLKVEILKLLCNHTKEFNGTTIDALVYLGDDICQCSICGKKFKIMTSSDFNNENNKMEEIE